MLGKVTGFACRQLGTIKFQKHFMPRIQIFPTFQRFSSQNSGSESSSKPPRSYNPPPSTNQGAKSARPSFDPQSLSQIVKGNSKPAPRYTGPTPTYDKAVLEALGIDHVPPETIAQVLQEEQLTIEELMVIHDAKLHEQSYLSTKSPGQNLQEATEWDESMVEQINPRRRFYPGQTYTPEELSPLHQPDHHKRRDAKKKSCPLGGKKGPKIDFANVALISRFVTDGGRLMGRRKTRVCAKKQRELTRAVKRARVMNLIPYLHKLPEFMRKESYNPLLD